jgi:plastocyanin
MRTKFVWTAFTIGLLAFVLSACGSGSSNGSTPTTPSNPTSTNTITIANNTVSPKNVVVARGSQVTFVNNDNRNHDMHSDPHPDHTDCPPIEQVGFLAPGQSKQTWLACAGTTTTSYSR